MGYLLAVLVAGVATIPVGAVPPKQTGNMPVLHPDKGRTTECPPISPHYAMKQGEGSALQKLNELPPAVHYKAAYRRIDGCQVPIIAGYPLGQERMRTRTAP